MAAKKIDIEHLNEELGDLGCDIRAEVIAGQIKANGVSGEISFVRKGSFSRQFRRDIARVASDLENGFDSNKLIVEVNREGVYDYLPEDLFHFSPLSNSKKDTGQIIEQVRRQRQQEADARSFFAPIEDELSHLLLRLEGIENETVQSVTSDHGLLHFFEDARELEGINSFQRAKLLFFLPLAHRFRGNVGFLNFILKTLLNHRCKVSTVRKKIRHDRVPQLLGEMTLGVNAITGGQSEERFTIMRFSVFDLHPEEVRAYSNNGNAAKVIDKIIEFFVPLHLSVEIDLNFTKETKFATTSSAESFTLLGYNSVI